MSQPNLCSATVSSSPLYPKAEGSSGLDSACTAFSDHPFASSSTAEQASFIASPLLNFVPLVSHQQPLINAHPAEPFASYHDTPCQLEIIIFQP